MTAREIAKMIRIETGRTLRPRAIERTARNLFGREYRLFTVDQIDQILNYYDVKPTVLG